MSLSHSSKRILVVGREVGPITRLIKNNIPEVFIGAVDVLGNKETRFYADLKFSVEKQVPDISIFRPKHRNILDFLFQLTLIMLEDLEFDFLIPLAPFQTNPDYLHQLSKEVHVLFANNRTLEQVMSAHSFLINVDKNFPEKLPPPVPFSVLAKLSTAKFPSIFVSANRTYFFSSKASLASSKVSNEIGFLFPLSQVHCAFFTSSLDSLHFLGLQTLSSPFDHEIFPNELDKNALLPFSLSQGFLQEKIISYLSKIIIQLNLIGVITIYFVTSRERIFPISCNVLPDGNFDLWEKRSSRSLIQYLLSLKDENNSFPTSSNFAFKLPIYSHTPISVPPILKTLASERNLPRVISYPEYPICTISGDSSSFSGAYHLLQQKKAEIIKILHHNL